MCIILLYTALGNEEHAEVELKDLKINEDLFAFESFNSEIQGSYLDSIAELAPDAELIYKSYQEGLEAARKGEWEVALKHLSLALKDLGRQSDWYVKILCTIGNVHLICKENSKAIGCFLKALESSQRDEELARIYDCLAKVYHNLSEYGKALKYYQKAQWFNDNITKDENLAAIISVHLGGFHLDLFQLDKAEQYFHKAIAIYEKKQSLRELSFCYSLLSDCLQGRRMFADALLKLNKALDIAHTHGYNRLASEILLKMGMVYINSGDRYKGMLFLDEAFYQSELVGNELISGLILNLMGQFSTKDNDADAAIEYLLRSVEKFDTKGREDRLEATYEILVNMYENRGDYKKALSYSKKANKLRFQFCRKAKEKRRLCLEMIKKEKLFLNEREIKLIKKRNELQRYIAEKDQHIQDLNRQLASSNEEFRSLSYAAAHDLKEPLRTIGSFSQLLSRKIEDTVELDQEGREYFDFIQEGINRMDNLLKDLTEYSSLKVPAEVVEKVDLNQALVNSLYNLDKEIRQSGSMITADRMPVITSSYPKMVQLFQQLIDNSIKYSGDESPVIKIKVEENVNEYTFTVKDKGMGIERSMQKKAFQMFQKLHNIGQCKVKGSGIGLSMCKKIITQLGGKIWLNSNLGEGCTVFFTIPKIVK